MEKKQYNQPNVEVLDLRLGNCVMAGSPGSTLPISGTPIPGAGGD